MMDDNKKSPIELNLCSVKEFLWSKGGKCQYSELFDHFRGSITESEHDDKFQEFISNIAVKKYDESNDEWICLKKKFQDPANAHSGFFASTFQKTKNNLSKLSNKAFMKDKENKMNTSGTNLSASDSSPRRSSSLMSLGYVESEETEPSAKIGMSQSMQSLNSTIVDEQTKSVKEQARELNRKNTESELKLRGQNMSESKLSLGKSGARLNKHVEVEYFDFSDPQPCEKEWILVCSSGDYMQIAKLLFKQPYLAQKKDPFNTVVHWACKYGNLDLLKLVASTLENDNKTNPKALRINHLINTRTVSLYLFFN
ncbi:ankyrin repeat domain-containing SOWAHB isoform X1 [Brachionus plicatilis]|uniref:Ankyrin repeat domain-containing SOWAHB isoform X1 n=1 Tax=Brachionus plicatilis TaxID=10195 RepID=A0A3M7RRG7_BRAPC|nr:ankyrin repeat domain-containing SOWAHB isoform X1 [Brachionus plicatilis]